MAEDHHQLLHDFYASFQAGDAQGMVACYHPEVRFEDPAFGVLEGERAGKMWHFLVARSKGQLELDFKIVKANEQGGKVHWEARYTFTSTGRPVHNRITATFEFRDGKIIRHTDVFSFWRWAHMAFGTTGLLLGWTPLLKNKVRASVTKALDAYTIP